MIRLLVAAAVLVAPATVLAQSTESAAPAAQAAPAAASAEAPAPEKEKMVCRIEGNTGSIMRRRVCRTASEAARDAEQAQRQIDNARNERQGRDLTQFGKAG